MKHVDFLFVYEVKARELEGICLLGAYLMSKGYSVAYINSWESIYSKPIAYNASVIIISACYRDSVYDFFTAHAARFSKVVNLQWEQVIANLYLESKTNTSWDFSGVALETRHICWGNLEKQRLQERYKISSQFLYVTGYLPLDFYREEFKKLLIPRNVLFEKFNIDPNKKTALFVSSFSLCGLPPEEMPNAETEALLELIRIEELSQEIIIEWFETFVKKHPEIQIVYRYHPSENKNNKVTALAQKYQNFHLVNELPIKYWISSCDILINWISTSMIEMYASKKNTIMLRPIDIPNRIDIPYFSACSAIKTYDEFEKHVLSDDKIEFPINPKDILQYYDIQEEPTYKRIGDMLIDTYKNNDYKSRPSRDNMHSKIFKKQIKKHLGSSKLFYRFICRMPEKESGVFRYTKKLKNVIKSEMDYANRRLHDEYWLSRKNLNSSNEREIEQLIVQYKEIIS